MHGFFASSDAVPYALFSVVACLVLAALAGLVALRQRRSGPDPGRNGWFRSKRIKDPLLASPKDERRRSSSRHLRRRREQLPPLPEPLFGRAAQGAMSVPDSPSFRLVPSEGANEPDATDSRSPGR